jgi:hypothetical protein
MDKPLNIIKNSLSPELESGMPDSTLNLKCIELSVKSHMAFLKDDEENKRAINFVLGKMNDDNDIPDVFCYPTLVENFIYLTTFQYEKSSLNVSDMTLPLPLTLLQCGRFRNVCGNCDGEVEEDFINKISLYIEEYTLGNIECFVQQYMFSLR